MNAQQCTAKTRHIGQEHHNITQQTETRQIHTLPRDRPSDLCFAIGRLFLFCMSYTNTKHNRKSVQYNANSITLWNMVCSFAGIFLAGIYYPVLVCAYEPGVEPYLSVQTGVEPYLSVQKIPNTTKSSIHNYCTPEDSPRKTITADFAFIKFQLTCSQQMGPISEITFCLHTSRSTPLCKL